MKRTSTSFVVILAFCASLNVSGQNRELDSIWNAFSRAKNDTTRIRLYLLAGAAYKNEMPDTAMFYYGKALELADTTIEAKSSSLIIRRTVKQLKANSLHSIGAAHSKGNPDKALEYYSASIKIMEELDNKKGIAICNTSIGQVHTEKGNYDKALEYYNKSLEIDEAIGNKNGVAMDLQKIGIVYYYKSVFDEALDFLFRALKIFEELGDKQSISSCFNNIGGTYSIQDKYDEAIDYFMKSLEISEAMGNKKMIADCYNNIGIIYYRRGLYDSTIAHFVKSSDFYKELGYKSELSLLYNNIGTLYRTIGVYDKANEYFLMSLQICEDMGNKRVMAACYSGMGLVYMEQVINDKAIEYLLKSIGLKEEMGDKNGLTGDYVNIGLVYKSQGDLNKAIEYNMKSLKLCKELGKKSVESTCYTNLGAISASQGNYEKAHDYYLKSIKLQEVLGDKRGISFNYHALANLKLIMADSLAELNEGAREMYLHSALDYAKDSYNLAQELKEVPLQNSAADKLYKIYSKLGRYREALKFSEIYISTQDSMFSEAKTKALAEMSTKYEAEKKQFQIEKMEKQKELDDKTIEAQQAENRRQKTVITSVIGGFIVILVFSLVILNMFRQKRLANILLAKQNDEIKQQKEEISLQKDKIEAQRDILGRQNIMLNEQKKEITDSIRYAKRIQTALLPGRENAKDIFGEHFILFKPKDIVSGDFYWGTMINEWRIVTVADCTGHGVPGAFMSMLGISFLNEIVRKKEITNASEIIEHLRNEIIEALQQKGSSGEQKDGLDIALCVINTKTNEVQFCGAYNGLIIVNSSKEIKEISPDKMPVSIYENMKPFTNHTVRLQRGDMLYLKTDGFEDQFGGQDDKKFKISQMKDLFVSFSNKPVSEQLELFNTAFENWKGEYQQTDDVTVLGIRIG